MSTAINHAFKNVVRLDLRIQGRLQWHASCRGFFSSSEHLKKAQSLRSLKLVSVWVLSQCGLYKRRGDDAAALTCFSHFLFSASWDVTAVLNGQNSKQIETKSPEVVLEPLLPFRRYTVRIAARNNLGIGPFSKTFLVSFSCIVWFYHWSKKYQPHWIVLELIRTVVSLKDLE